MLADRQTHKETDRLTDRQTHLSQYSAIPTEGGVNMKADKAAYVNVGIAGERT